MAAIWTLDGGLAGSRSTVVVWPVGFVGEMWEVRCGLADCSSHAVNTISLQGW
jgi:hypothetical protein